jgi:hypothetical protein
VERTGVGGVGQERKEVDFLSGCSDVKRPRNKRRPPGAGRRDVKKNMYTKEK